LGIEKPDLDEVKEIKVKLPVRQLLRLQYAKLTSRRNFSQVVCDALTVYFDDEVAHARAA
jgi:hypothetical protein